MWREHLSGPFDTRTVQVGGMAEATLRERYAELDIGMNPMARRLWPTIDFDAIRLHTAETVELSVAALGLPEGATSAEILAQAAKYGLQAGPLELAVFLRLAFTTQAPGPWLTVASPDMAMERNLPNGFYVRNIDGRLWLRGYTASADHGWSADDFFAFVPTKVSAA